MVRVPVDACVIDLEDGTPAADKEAARAVLADNVETMRQEGVRGSILVRINAPGTPFYEDDLAAALAAPVDGFVLPKFEDVAIVQDIVRRANEADARAAVRIVGGIETVKGVLNAENLCSASPVLIGVYFGSEDLATEIGAARTEDGAEMLYARSKVLLAAKAAGIAAIDQAVTEVRDDERFRADGQRGRQLGYEGKICLNLRQAELANEMFAPTDDEVARCEQLVATYERAVAAGKGTLAFDGQMIDVPLVERARATLALARVIEGLEQNR